MWHQATGRTGELAGTRAWPCPEMEWFPEHSGFHMKVSSWESYQQDSVAVMNSKSMLFCCLLIFFFQNQLF